MYMYATLKNLVSLELNLNKNGLTMNIQSFISKYILAFLWLESTFQERIKDTLLLEVNVNVNNWCS